MKRVSDFDSPTHSKRICVDKASGTAVGSLLVEVEDDSRPLEKKRERVDFDKNYFKSDFTPPGGVYDDEGKNTIFIK